MFLSTQFGSPPVFPSAWPYRYTYISFCGFSSPYVLRLMLAFSLPKSLGSSVAFDAMVSIATMALYIAYGLPIFFRVTLARKHFKPGPFSLGRYGLLVGWIAVFWVVTITVLFSLPVAFPVTLKNLNYTPIAASALVVFVLSSWFLSARHWFQGPATMK